MGLLSRRAVVPSCVPSPSQLGLRIRKNVNIGSNTLARAAAPRPAKAGAVDDPQAPKLMLSSTVVPGDSDVPQPHCWSSLGFVPWGFLCFYFVDEPKRKGSTWPFSKAAAPPSSGPDLLVSVR